MSVGCLNDRYLSKALFSEKFRKVTLHLLGDIHYII